MCDQDQFEEGLEGAGARPNILIDSQASKDTVWRLSGINLAIRGIDVRSVHRNTIHTDRRPDLKADFIVTNPPFSVSNWGGERLCDNQCWQHGAPHARRQSQMKFEASTGSPA